ncbi:MAG TPA: hypothetical protein EYP56_18300, partial [Planctomycetaceae bacterium]|nr:hypothetical protein [Planctomycetaceae bacterium]
MRAMSLIVALGWLVAAVAVRGAERPDVEQLLKHEIIGSVLPLAEVQRFCETRVIRMPEVKTADGWCQQAERIRSAVLERVIYRGEAARWRDAATRVQWLETIDGGPGYRIRKLRFEALPGLWIPALLYEPLELSGKVPGVLNVNGHTALGKQYPPKQIRCINQAKRGILALNVEWLGMGQLRGPGYGHDRMNQLDLCGTSGLAPFYLLLKRSLDLLLSLDHVDPQRVAVTGLSGGGWQTIVISALDERVKLSNPVAGYSSFRTRAYHFKDLGDSEQTPTDLATVADYTHLTAMLAPRPALLTYNAKDNCCFESGYALEPLLDAARPIYELFGRLDALRHHVNHEPGTHNYEQENREVFYQMLADFFYPDDPDFRVQEIPCEDEIKTAEQLAVPLPEDNATFQSLALGLAKDLPRCEALPKDEAGQRAWRRRQRRRLAQIVRAVRYSVQPIQRGQEEQPPLHATFWQLKMDGTWTVPAVELAGAEPRGTALLVA